MMPAFDIGRLDRAAMETGRPLLQKLAPGKLRGPEYVALNGDGALGPVRINYKTFDWADDATGDRGQGAASWLAHIRQMPPDDAAREVAASVGIEIGDSRDDATTATPAPEAHVNGETNGAVVVEAREDNPAAAVSDAAVEGDTGGPLAQVRAALAFPVPAAELAQAPAIESDKDTDAEIARLAALSPFDYERERKAAAKRLGIERVAVLDVAVKAARGADGTKGQGRAFQIPEIEPWPEAVNGAELLDDMVTAIRRYMVMPTGAAETAALWAVHTHCFDAFMITPRLAIQSPEKGCGKTTLLDTIACLTARPLPTSNVTAAVVFRVVEMAKPTLLVDEADTFLKDNEQLRGILNSGHRRGGAVLRTEGENLEPRQFATHAPAAIALIGRLPDTLEDRSVAIRLRRRKPTERVESFRSDRADHLTELARKATRWCADHRERLTDNDPNMGELFNRVADNWRPLFTIADAAGGRWPELSRTIASAAAAQGDEQSGRVQLLADIRWIMDGQPEAGDDGATAPKFRRMDQIASADLVAQLVKIEGRPWAELPPHDKPMTVIQLARRLGHFQIQPGTIWFDDQGQRKSLKGYKLADLTEAFECYLPLRPVTASQPLCRSGCDVSRPGTGKNGVTGQETSQPLCRSGCDGVTGQNPNSSEMAGGIDL